MSSELSAESMSFANSEESTPSITPEACAERFKRGRGRPKKYFTQEQRDEAKLRYREMKNTKRRQEAQRRKEIKESLTERQQLIMKYLKEHKLNDEQLDKIFSIIYSPTNSGTPAYSANSGTLASMANTPTEAQEQSDD